jgi:hypothetical protein
LVASSISLHKKRKIGVKIEKITILEDTKDGKPFILKGLQKITKILALTS